MKNRQRKLVVLLCAAMSFSALGGCGQKEVAEEVAEDVAIVETLAPRIGDLKLSSEFIATVNPDESVYIIPKATAEVMEVKVKAGDIVEAGDVLAILDDTMAQLSMRSAQLTLDNAQRAYTLSYGDGASLLNDMQTDSNVQKVEDGIETQQEGYLDAMDSLSRYQNLLAEAQKELADVKKEYDYREDPEEILDYANSIDKNTIAGAAEYQAAMARYQSAATLHAQWSAKVDGYKQAIDGCEQALEELQDGINSTYETFSQTATSVAITNGELREEQKKVSQNSISAAQLAVEQAQEGLDSYVITASIGGVVENVNVKVHDFATSSSPAFVISNKDTMMATYYVSEDVRNTFSLGQQIEIEKDGNTYKGEVLEIGGTIDATTGLFKIKAGIKGDTSKMLSGTKVKVTTDTYYEKDAMIIPYDAVYYDGTQPYVYTVVDGKAKKTNILTGLYDVEEIVVVDGLSKEDEIITTWSAQLREGVTVSVKVEEEQ